MRVLASAGALLALAGCASVTAHDARSGLLGKSQEDMIACAGVPDTKQRLDSQDAVLGWTYENDNSLLSLDVLTAGTLSLGGRGKCQLVALMHNGVVAHVSYPDATGSIEGPLAACGPIVAECLKHPVHIIPPAGTDPMAIVAEPRS